MPATRLVRLSGIALILGGIGVFIHYLTHPPGESAQFVAMPLWIFSHWIAFPAWILILLGLVGVYARISEKIGLLGLIFFIFAFGSGMLAGPGDFLVGGVVQVLSPDFGNPGGPLETVPMARMAFDLAQIWLLAFPLFALATLRASILPRTGAWLIILTFPLAIVALTQLRTNPSIAYDIAILASAILAVGFGIWGYALLSSDSRMATTSRSTR